MDSQERQLTLQEKWGQDAVMYKEVAMRNPEKYAAKQPLFEKFFNGEISLEEYRKKAKELDEKYLD